MAPEGPKGLSVPGAGEGCWSEEGPGRGMVTLRLGKGDELLAPGGADWSPTGVVGALEFADGFW